MRAFILSLAACKCMDKHPYTRCSEAHSCTPVLVHVCRSVSRMLLAIVNVHWHGHISLQDDCPIDGVYNSFCFSTALVELTAVWLLKCIANLMNVKWCLTIVCIFLITIEIEHLFMCLLAICVSSLLNCLFTFFAFASVVLSFFSLVEVVHCVFCLLNLYQSLTVQRSSPSPLLVSYFVYGVFWCTDKFNFNVVNYFAIFIIHAFESYFFKKFPNFKIMCIFSSIFFLKFSKNLIFTLSMGSI